MPALWNSAPFNHETRSLFSWAAPFSGRIAQDNDLEFLIC
jgi:hypothetical protein